MSLPRPIGHARPEVGPFSGASFFFFPGWPFRIWSVGNDQMKNWWIFQFLLAACNMATVSDDFRWPSSPGKTALHSPRTDPRCAPCAASHVLPGGEKTRLWWLLHGVGDRETTEITELLVKQPVSGQTASAVAFLYGLFSFQWSLVGENEVDLYYGWTWFIYGHLGIL